MKFNLKILLFFFFPLLVNAQQNIDSLKSILIHGTDASLRYKAARGIYDYYEEKNRDTALYYADQSVLIAKQNSQKVPEAFSLVNKGYQLVGLGRFGEALQCFQKSFSITEDPQNEKGNTWDLSLYNFVGKNYFNGNQRLLTLAYAHHMFAVLMLRTENVEQQIIHFKTAGKIGQEVNWIPRVMLAYMNLGQSYLTINKPDSALFFESTAERLALELGYKKYLGNVEVLMGDINQLLDKPSLALEYYYNGIHISTEQNNLSSLSRNNLRLIRYHLASGNKDSALYYSKRNLYTIQLLGSVTGAESNIGLGYENMYLSYQLNQQFDSAFKYLALAFVSKDSLNKLKIKNLAEFQNISFAEQLRLKNVEKEKAAYQSTVKTYSLLAGLTVLLLAALILYYSNRQKNRSNKVLHKTLTHLKSTQSQLIQSEKMASLGELTAGIAHEIQNPLNFVNNFSEVSTELVDEMNEEIIKGNIEAAKEIASDLKQNLAKINHHGKRAGDIVKGMLQHSSSGSGKKEPTDINKLADEYLRLAYHGLRAKDKSFSATMKTDFDESIGNINIISQDIGRVILNLITNAFYVVDEKKRSGMEGYEPTVSVSTKKLEDKVLISVQDNGNGIPKKVLDKIFQPFFTTKPTGQGTGLGLSLSYDIVKAHGGELKVHTQENEGTTFIIILPNTNA